MNLIFLFISSQYNDRLSEDDLACLHGILDDSFCYQGSRGYLIAARHYGNAVTSLEGESTTTLEFTLYEELDFTPNVTYLEENDTSSYSVFSVVMECQNCCITGTAGERTTAGMVNTVTIRNVLSYATYCRVQILALLFVSRYHYTN